MATDSGEAGAFKVVPGDIPNRGILFVDHSATGRSGHGGNCLTECANGDIISFYSNVSGEELRGHGVGGWSEYRRSTDGGRTWGEPVVLEYSRRAWEGDEVYSALVFAVTAAPDGALIAVISRFANTAWVKKLPPVYLLSLDNGHTWSEPRDVDPGATVDDISLTFDAVFTHEGEVFIVFMGGSEDYCPGPFSLYVSDDNGRSFHRRSLLPFDNDYYYATAGVLSDGRIIVYSYAYHSEDNVNEYDLPYVISSDGGRTWSRPATARFARRLRNPQLSAQIGGLYFMHGRSGNKGQDAKNLVLYSSPDGINWDEGTILYKKEFGGGDCYSANEVIGKHNPSSPRRLLIQSSISYDPASSRVNEHHWWVDVPR